MLYAVHCALCVYAALFTGAGMGARVYQSGVEEWGCIAAMPNTA